MTREFITAMADSVPVTLACWLAMFSSHIRGLKTNGRYTFPLLSWHELDEEMSDEYLEEYDRTHGKILDDEIAEVEGFIKSELQRVGYDYEQHQYREEG